MSNTPKKIKKIVVDRNLCIGSASCVAIASSVFELDDENKSAILQKNGVKNSGPADRGNLLADVIDEVAVLEAAQACPTKAISLFDEDGNPIYP